MIDSPKNKPKPTEAAPPGDAAAGDADSTADLAARLAEAESRYLRVLADYQNSQRRARSNEAEASVQARTEVVQGVLSVVDHFDLALAQDARTASAEQIVGGVRVIRDELMRVLQSYGVGIVNPAPDDEFVPSLHQAIMEQPGEGVTPGHVVATLQTGYTITTPAGERVIRPAKVSVAPAASARD